MNIVLAINASSQGINEQDSLALVALYNSCGGLNWTNQNNWLTGEVKDWYGIATTNGRVTGVDLVQNNLVGIIPKEIGNLNNLFHLTLFDNQLTGPIPSELGNLNNLRLLYLMNNQLTGSIPPELGNLNNLTALLLMDNQLTGPIPSELGNLNNLKLLYLMNNQLTGPIPPELGNLNNLTMLLLMDNKLSGPIPSELRSLRHLSLYLYNNKFTFKDIANSGIVDGDLTAFLYSPQAKLPAPTVEQEDNNITFSLPVGHEDNAYQWYWDGNNINGAEDRIFITSKYNSGIYRCEVTNPLYPSLTLYTEEVKIKTIINPQDSLALVALYNNCGGPNWTNNDNWLAGEANDWYGVVVNRGKVTELDLSDNDLIDSIPADLGNLSNLSILYLDHNQLSGSIPSELGNLSNLTYLYLDGNKFTFKDIANSGIVDGDLETFLYSPQAQLSIPEKTQNTNIPWNYVLSMPEDHENNVYHWYRNGNEISGANVRQYTIPDFSGGDFYCKITNSLYPVLTLESETINIPSTVGIDDPESSQGLMVYPNPTNDELIIALIDKSAGQYRFEIYNFYGKIIDSFEENLNTTFYRKELDCSQYAAGTYLLKIISKAGVAVQKFTVQH